MAHHASCTNANNLCMLNTHPKKFTFPGVLECWVRIAVLINCSLGLNYINAHVQRAAFKKYSLALCFSNELSIAGRNKR